MPSRSKGRLERCVTVAGALACALIVWIPGVAESQSRGSRGLDRAQTFLVLRLAEALDLTTEEALRISEILRNAQQRRQDLRREGEGVISEIHTELDRRPSDPQRLRQLIRRGNELYRELALIPEQSFEEAQKLLTVDQQAKLILFRYEWMTRLQKELRRRRKADR